METLTQLEYFPHAFLGEGGFSRVYKVKHR